MGSVAPRTLSEFLRRDEGWGFHQYTMFWGCVWRTVGRFNWSGAFDCCRTRGTWGHLRRTATFSFFIYAFYLFLKMLLALARAFSLKHPAPAKSSIAFLLFESDPSFAAALWRILEHIISRRFISPIIPSSCLVRMGILPRGLSITLLATTICQLREVMLNMTLF